MDVTINWQQPGAVVHSFYKGTTHPEHQGKRYQGRTQLFPAEFPKGNTSLLLRGVTPSDSGNYSCYAVLGANTPLTACTVELQVTGRTLVPLSLLSLLLLPRCKIEQGLGN